MSNHQAIAELMSRMVNLVDDMMGMQLQRSDQYTLDRVLNGVVHPIVLRIDSILRTLHSENLTTGDYSEWRAYVENAVTLVESKQILSNESSRFYNTPVPFELRFIEKRFEQHRNRKTTTVQTENATFCIVQGVDALTLPISRFTKDAIVQVASQFNFLESKTPTHCNITEYIDDRTQGPRASLGSLAALIVRDSYLSTIDKNAEFFRLVMAKKCYSGGYFMPYALSQHDQTIVYASLINHKNRLNILAQWGKSDLGSHPILQIFTAAPSYQDADPPETGSTGEQICILLVEAQYRAVAQIAAMRSLVSGTRVSLHLTLVGQGAFNNPPSVLASALRAVYETVRYFEVDVFIHGYSDSDVEKIEHSLPTGVQGFIRKMTKEYFFS